jgi:hypothetical protein
MYHGLKISVNMIRIALRDIEKWINHRGVFYIYRISICVLCALK